MFQALVKGNCYSKSRLIKWLSANLLEKLYACEINCVEMARGVLFAHHGRGCTVVAAKLCAGVVIFQNVTIGSNQKYNKLSGRWENVGNPIIGEGVVIADGAKILGPIVIGDHSFIAAGAIVTKDIPANSLAFGVNQHRERDGTYDYVYSRTMIDSKEIIQENKRLIGTYERGRSTAARS